MHATKTIIVNFSIVYVHYKLLKNYLKSTMNYFIILFHTQTLLFLAYSRLSYRIHLSKCKQAA